MRLSDEIAARRLLYSRPVVTAPALLVIDIPGRYRGPGLALGRYYPVIIETDEELDEFEAFLDADRVDPGSPDLLDRRPSRRAASAITFFEYAPPEPGWPWLLLCHWPRDYTERVRGDPTLLARGAYTTETFAAHGELLSTVAEFVNMLGDTVRLCVISPAADVAGSARLRCRHPDAPISGSGTYPSGRRGRWWAADGQDFPPFFVSRGACRDRSLPRRDPSGPDRAGPVRPLPSPSTPTTFSSSATHRPPRAALGCPYTAMVPADGDYFARGAYTIVFTDPSELDRAELRSLAMLGTHRPRTHRSVFRPSRSSLNEPRGRLAQPARDLSSVPPRPRGGPRRGRLGPQSASDEVCHRILRRPRIVAACQRGSGHARAASGQENLG